MWFVKGHRTQTLNQEMFALLIKADVCEALSPKGYWHVSVLIYWFLKFCCYITESD